MAGNTRDAELVNIPSFGSTPVQNCDITAHDSPQDLSLSRGLFSFPSSKTLYFGSTPICNCWLL
jgi:hypothetical protein